MSRHPHRRRRLAAGVTCLVLAALLFGASSCRRERTRALTQLGSEDARTRVVALEHLADTATDADLPALVGAARDPRPEVRRAAIHAIGRRTASAAIDRLGDALGDPDPTVQRTAIAALAASEDRRARAWLLSAYVRRGPDAREAIVSALGRHGVGPLEVVRGEAERIWERDLQALRRGSLAERAGAAEELGRSGRPEVQGILGALLSDESAIVAAAAARGLGAAGDPAALPHLVGLLGDPSPPVRDAAADALGRLGDPRAIDPLAAVALSGTASALQAAHALARLPGSAEAACDVAHAVQDGGVARVLAAHAERKGAACDIGQPADGAAARVADLHDPAEPGRDEGEEGGRPGAVPSPDGDSKLAGLLRRVDGWRSRKAASQEAQAGEPSRPEHVRSMLFHDRPEVRGDAARILEARPDPLASQMLQALAQADYFVEVRAAAAKALEALRRTQD